MCLYPRLVDGQYFRCRCCIKCRLQQSYEWAARVKEEVKSARSGRVINLSYTEENVPWKDTLNGSVMTLEHRDVQLFMKRLRKENSKYLKKESLPVSTLWKGEYGEKRGRPHYHGIVLNLEPETMPYIEQKWKLGHVDKDLISDEAIAYVVNYMAMQKWEGKKSGQKKPYLVPSKFFGADYISRNWIHHAGRPDKDSLQGHKQKLPTYYVNKMYTEEEKKEISELRIGRFKELIEKKQKENEFYDEGIERIALRETWKQQENNRKKQYKL